MQTGIYEAQPIAREIFETYPVTRLHQLVGYSPGHLHRAA